LNGWIEKFAKRNGLSIRRRSNLKQLSFVQKLPAIRAFYRRFLAILKEGTPVDPVWGNYPLQFRANIDQVPCAFLLGKGKTEENYVHLYIYLHLK